MAGRVERRINDKFYFVLDEVGGSSDCESELADSDGKLSSPLTQKGAGQSKRDSNIPKDTCSDFKHPDLQLNTYNKTISEDGCISGKDEAFTIISVVDENKAKSTQRSKNVDNMLPEVVDMEIDSDVEILEQRQEPILKVTFRDANVRKRLNSCILRFFSQKLKDCTVVSNSENGLEIDVYDKNSKESIEEDLLDFILDTTPGDNSEVPNYGRAHNLILSDTNLDEKQNTEKLPFSISCFNCMGNHNLRDCKLQKNFEVINKNRILFKAKPQKERGLKVSRYHLDENQKFSHIVPGAISKKLRNALNLRRDQQPEFIYRMRVLGYPPAWLEEAKVSHSGVAMYDDTGVPVLDEDEEEGEILPEGAKDKFDITKIIEFPGFNMPLPNNFRDETKFYRCPTLSEEQSKESLINILKPKTVQAYVKKSLSSQKSQEKSEADGKGGSSPTIEEMEEKKRQLLMELSNEDSPLDRKPGAENTSMAQTPSKESGAFKELGTVKNLEFGTPILKSISPFAKLPSREQFSYNINDVIQFENLPNSTGKYETIRHVISKIRTTSSKNHKSDD